MSAWSDQRHELDIPEYMKTAISDHMVHIPIIQTTNRRVTGIQRKLPDLSGG